MRDSQFPQLPEAAAENRHVAELDLALFRFEVTLADIVTPTELVEVADRESYRTALFGYLVEKDLKTAILYTDRLPAAFRGQLGVDPVNSLGISREQFAAIRGIYTASAGGVMSNVVRVMASHEVQSADISERTQVARSIIYGGLTRYVKSYDSKTGTTVFHDDYAISFLKLCNHLFGIDDYIEEVAFFQRV